MTVKKQHSVLTWLVRACGAFAWRRASPSFRPASGRGDRVLSPAGRRCRRRWVSRPALRRRPPRTGAWGVPASDEGRMSLDDVVHAWVLDKRVQRSSTRQSWGSRRWLRASEMGPWLASPAAQWPRPAPPWGRRWLATRRIYMHGCGGECPHSIFLARLYWSRILSVAPTWRASAVGGCRRGCCGRSWSRRGCRWFPESMPRTWTKSLQSVEERPGLQAEDEGGDGTCVCSEEAAAPPRVSPTVARVGGGLVTAGDSRSRFPDRRR
jgi:hypothetical protein